MAEIPPHIDEWLSGRDRTPLSPNRLLRYEYVSRGKRRDLDLIADIDLDGNVVGASELPWWKRSILRRFAARLRKEGHYVGPPVEVKGGQYEILTVMVDGKVHQVVFDSMRRRELEVLREAVQELR